MIPKKKTSETDIGSDKFYLFKNIYGDFVLFDSTMEYPIRYGSINKITSLLQFYKNKLGEKFELYQFIDNNREGLKKNSSGLKINPLAIDFPSVGFPTFPVKKVIPKTNRDKIYYHFKLTPSTHILFDSELNSSISYGSKNEILSQYKNMPTTSTTYYFEKNDIDGFKMKMCLKSNNSRKSETETKITAEKEKDKLK